MNKNISLVVNTKNEEPNIVDCINSARKIADEVVVVDMGSTDRTVEIVKKLGVKVYHVKNYDIVGPARAYAINKATNEWVLLLDADERMTEILVDKLKLIVEKDTADVVKVPFKNIIFGKWIKHTWWWPDYHPRFFKKSFVKWPALQQPHVQPIISGRVLTLPAKENNAIVHYNYRDITQFVNRMNRYTTYKGASMGKSKITAEYFIRHFEEGFVNRYIYQKGYLDGMHGFVLSKLMEYYHFLEMAKSWESSGYTNTSPVKTIYQLSFKHYRKYINSSEGERIGVLLGEIGRTLKKIMLSRLNRLTGKYHQAKEHLSKGLRYE